MTMRTGLWNSLESFTTPVAVLAEWQRNVGPDFCKARAFLRPMQSQAESYPCTNRPGCGLRHEVREVEGSNDLLAVLQDELVSCPAIRLQPRDVVNHELDAGALIGAIRKAFKFCPVAPSGMSKASRTHRIGEFGSAQSPVALIIVADESSFLKEFEKLCVSIPVPFIVLTPTPAHCTAAVDGALRQHGCAYVPLSEHLVLGEGGRFKVEKPIDGILAEFERRLAEGKGLVETVERIDRNIEAVVKRDYEQRKEIEDLKRLGADGYLKFVRSVDPLDFSCFIFILALGDRAKAARDLGMDERKFYRRVDSWATRGKEYQRMYALVQCRKTSLQKGTVPLGASLQSGGVNSGPENPETIQAVLDQMKAGSLDQKDYPGVLQEILNALAEMNMKNWQAIRGEVMALIREEVPQ